MQPLPVACPMRGGCIHRLAFRTATSCGVFPANGRSWCEVRDTNKKRSAEKKKSPDFFHDHYQNTFYSERNSPDPAAQSRPKGGEQERIHGSIDTK